MNIVTIRNLVYLSAFVYLIAAAHRASATVYFRDDFNGGISSSWTIIRQDASYYTSTPSSLVIRASNGWLTGPDGNNTKNLFLINAPTSEAFAVTLRCYVFAPPAVNYAQLDLLAYDSDDNHVRCNYGHIVGQRQLEFGTEISSTWTPSQTPHDFGSSPFYLQLVKEGTDYSQFWSTDGVQFVQANTVLQYGDGTPAYVGFVASDDPTQSAVAHLDWFEVTEIPEPAAAVGGLALALAGARMAGQRSRRAHGSV